MLVDRIDIYAILLQENLMPMAFFVSAGNW